MPTATWTPQVIWSVPREWPGERCFILCGGESLKAQRHLVPKLQGRIIVVKEGVLLRPDADVLFLAGEHPEIIAPPLIKKFRGKYVVVRGRGHPSIPEPAKRVMRPLVHEGLCDDPTLVSGYDAGTSAINLAYHFGATEIVLLGYDMGGGRWFAGEHPHPMPVIPEAHFRKHMEPLPWIAADARRKGVRIVNCSPISRVDCFDRQPLEAFL
jgi:hypothetical protein